MITDKLELASLCREYAQWLPVPTGIDAKQLLWAIAGTESSFGVNSNPRHENEYCPQKHWHQKPAGLYELRAGIHAEAIAELTHTYGCWAHCSYGWAQIMFSNVKGAFTPLELMTSPEKVMQAVMSFLKSDVLPHIDCLEAFCHVYNGPGVSIAYMDEFKKNYSTPLPAAL